MNFFVTFRCFPVRGNRKKQMGMLVMVVAQNGKPPAARSLSITSTQGGREAPGAKKGGAPLCARVRIT
jgi:hypothetical protein